MRLKPKAKRGLLLAVFFCAMLSVQAQQQFKYSTSLQKIDSTGFYKISLQPGFVAKGRSDLFDVRLMDGRGNFVPYITARNLPQVQKAEFVALPHLDLKTPADTGTTFIVENNNKKPVSSLWVRLKSTAVTRTVNISGSDDLNKWFAIEENIPLEQDIESSDGTYMQSLTFPGSNYRYLKLLVNDKNKTPVKFLEAGFYSELSPVDLFFPVPKRSVVKKDSNNTSYITIELGEEYLVNKITLDIAAPKYYKRNISVFDIHGDPVADSFEIKSGKPADIFLSAKTNRLQLQVANGDNLPLTIKDIKLFQNDAFIVAYLEAGATYKLVTGNNNAAAPDYDLKFFTDSIKTDIPTITHGAVLANAVAGTSAKLAKPDHTMVIWLAIITALLLLSFLTWKMIGEIKSKTDGN